MDVKNSEDFEIEEFDSSELGTKEHWSNTYESELYNFTKNGDIGDIWFGEESIIRIVNWMDKCPFVLKTNSILDIGVGNGITLKNMHECGFKHLYGIDYCEISIELATAVLAKLDIPCRLEIGDILNPSLCDILRNTKFDICHDKGTFDAICLNPKSPKEDLLNYIKTVKSILNPKGLFIITSCNWTKDELLKHFSNYFELLEWIPTPSFQFGGRVGNTVTSLVLRVV